MNCRVEIIIKIVNTGPEVIPGSESIEKKNLMAMANTNAIQENLAHEETMNLDQKKNCMTWKGEK